MKDYFLNKFKEKTRGELQHIVDNKERYQSAAFNAAVQLLKEKKYEDPISLNIPEQETKKEDQEGHDILTLSFNPRPFFQILSYREFLTCTSFALLYITISEILDYYSNERIIEHYIEETKVIFLIFLLLGNHIFYKCENKKSNNFIGRFFIDSIFFICLILVRLLYNLILGWSYKLQLDFSVFISIIIAFIVLAFGFELGVAFLKFILKKLKCHIF